MAKIVMYKKNPCPYCDRAKNLLDGKGAKYEVIDLTDKPENFRLSKKRPDG
ncbi:MAG TPA: glutaredoxin domain-containing protein [Pseudobdellovibrionaceae bacterium]|nr:glutaredoxin domain-containing protein [Pseudobdellovibrionaceae bacterium]